MTTTTKDFRQTPREAHGPRYVTVQQQVWELTEPRHHRLMRQMFRRLKKRDQMDLSYGLIAYLRFGIVRPYEDAFLQALYESLIEVVNKK